MAAHIRVGPAGWSYEDWKGVVYPADMPRTSHPLEYLCRYFDTIEINSTFYRPPAPRNCAGWVANVSANPNFMFTAKLWQRFTHERVTWPGRAEIQQVCSGMEPLHEAGKLGAMLVQFPWSFKRTPENRKWLARVLETFAAYPLALEIRHASWNEPEVYEALAERRVAFCNIDQPLFRDSVAPSSTVTAKVGYVRLHGRNTEDWFRQDATRDERYDYLYGRDELSQWLRLVERMQKLAEDIYVITNNHYAGQAVVNAFELQYDIGGKKQSPPPSLVERYPRLREIMK